MHYNTTLDYSILNEFAAFPPGMPLHFIGVCGTAMAAVAMDMARRGWKVTGSDNQFYPPMSDLLVDSRVSILHQFNPDNLPNSGVIVVGNAVSRGNVELEEALNRNLPLISLPELIRSTYLPGCKSLVVAGTHGKTTTTAMAAHVYRSLGVDPGWMIGGDPVDLPFSCHKGSGEIFAIEGDEYDTAWFDKRPKFLLYRPYYVILTSIEFDHSDIYKNIDEIEYVFRRLCGLLPERGCLIVCGDDPLALSVSNSARCSVVTYGFGGECRWRISDVTPAGFPGAQGEIHLPGGTVRKISLKVSGKHNLSNALAVLAQTIENGCDVDDVLLALSHFNGVARRLQKLATGGDVVLYDDFAHHPTAILTTLSAVRRMHPNAFIRAIFEPRSNTMVRNFFQRELSEAFAPANSVVLGPLHRREKIPAEERLDAAELVNSLKKKGIEAVALESLDHASEELSEQLRPGDVVVVMSNGSFGGLTRNLTNFINRLDT